jgi:serine/threonine-protein kinase
MEAPVSVGEVLAGKYRVERVLGMGGMGVVIAALDLALERRVAIKFLLSDAMQNPEVVARFAREARAAVRIQSEHVARVIDVGALPSGAPYMVMEYLEGNDLAHRVAAQGALPVEEAIDYLLQACEAIAEAHALGIVHRDLKPANLILTRRTDGSNFVKVLDFGISKVTTGVAGSQPDLSLTKTSTVMGSPMYMSPEQMRSTRAVDARADIWALGVILYELISGKVPFEATTMPELCALVLTEPPPALRERCPWVPAAVAVAIDRCLQKDPSTRFANLSEFVNALVEFGPQKARHSAERISRVLRAAGVPTHSIAPHSAAASGAIAAARPGESTNTAWVPSSTGNTRRKSAVPLIAVAGTIALGATIVGVLLFHGHPASPDSAASAAAIASGAVSAEPAAPASATTVALAPAAPDVVPAPSVSASGRAAASALPTISPAKPAGAPLRASPAAKPSKGAAAPVAIAPAPVAPEPPKKRNPLDIGLK